MRRPFLATTLVILMAIPAWVSNRYPGMPLVAYFTLLAIGWLLVLLLLAISFIEPVPLWRSLAVIAEGADVIVLAIAHLAEHGMYEPRYRSTLDPTSVWVGLCLVLGIALALLGTLQLRGVLMRLYYRSAPHDKTTHQPTRG